MAYEIGSGEKIPCAAHLDGNTERSCDGEYGHASPHSDARGMWLEHEAVYLQEPAESVGATAVAPDPVNHPSHYTQGAIECIDAIEAALSPEEFAGFLRGNALKYLWRCGFKDDAGQDLAKAEWCRERLARHIAARVD